MADLLFPNEIVSMSSQAAKRLIDAGNGDGALLYLALLNYGTDMNQARQALKWSVERFQNTYQQLSQLGLVENVEISAAPQQVEDEKSPDYSSAEIWSALENEPSFSGLYRAVEGCLGKPMSELDLKSLYEIYDYLALPAEVILLLTYWCISETERKYGEGKRPRMNTVKKEAFRWKRMGLDTVESAEEFLQKQQILTGRERDILPILDIHNRPLINQERDYLSAWIDMGFPDEAIRLAYERTIFQKQRMNWPYMNSILSRWNRAGLHTLAEIEAGDKPPQKTGKEKSGPTVQDSRREAAQKLQNDVAWIDQFLKEQKE